MNETSNMTCINVIRVLKLMWTSRKFILKISCCAFAFGVMISLLMPEKYTAQCTIVPQSGKEGMSNVSGLAAMAGISLETPGVDLISPEIYPKVIANSLFLKDLMASDFIVGDDTISLLQYYTDETYQNTSFGQYLLKYTIGLPLFVKNWMKQEESEEKVYKSEIAAFSSQEYQCVRALSSCFSVDYFEKKGCVVISAEMSNAYLAAQLTAHVQRLLQQYVTSFKIEKAQAKLNFVNLRYMEAQCDFERKQQERAHFLDANWGLSTALARTQEERLTTDYNLLYSVCTELAKQREQASIAVKEDTPIFTVVEPVTIPMERSSPRRVQICVFWSLLGFVGALGWKMYNEKEMM